MMNSGLATIVSSVHNSISNTITINTTQLNAGMMSDGMSDPSSPESTFDASDIIMGEGIGDDVTSQLVASGPIGIAAAAAINSAKKKRRHHLFETNPAVRKRQQTRLLRKLRATIEEYTTRVGQQAVILCCTPGKSASMTNSYKVFGSQPLENVIKNCKGVIMQDLDTALAEQTPSNSVENSGVYDLPTLTLDGIPTPIDKMTQAQLRTFIPEMLKYSTGRSKPGWGKPEYRPIWWPNDLPWANVRSDVRTEQEKKAVSWTEALRSIVRNCYRHHGREDLLHIFGDDGSLTSEQQQAGQYTGTMVQTINNPDGTVSIIQIDTGPNSVVTLPDGTQATVVHSMTAIPQEAAHLVQQQQDNGQVVQTLSDVTTSQTDPSGVTVTPVSIEINEASHTLATLNGGRLMLTGDTTGLSTDGTGIMAIPVSMYQDIVASSQDKNIVVSSTDNYPLSSSAQIAMATIQQQNDTDQTQLSLQSAYQDSLDSQNITVQAISVETKSEPE